MRIKLICLALLGASLVAGAQPGPEGDVQYTWSYCLPSENRLSPEVVLKPKTKLPDEARLFIRLKNGPSKVTAVIFNSSRGQMEARELPLILNLAPEQSGASGWKRSNLSASKTYLALLLSDTAEADQIKQLRRDWERARDKAKTAATMPRSSTIRSCSGTPKTRVARL